MHVMFITGVVHGAFAGGTGDDGAGASSPTDSTVCQKRDVGRVGADGVVVTDVLAEVEHAD